MFTGIINHIGTIVSIEQHGDLRVTIECGFRDYRIGESIAINGACMTVVASDDKSFSIDVSGESVSRTSRWQVEQQVNLERSLKAGDPLDGHIVTGHVDGVATLINIDKIGDSHRLELEAPAQFAHFIAEKGSVTLDGVSLTVNKVEGARFCVNIIPHTWQKTMLSQRQNGDAVNLEIDILARYAARILQPK